MEFSTNQTTVTTPKSQEDAPVFTNEVLTQVHSDLLNLQQTLEIKLINVTNELQSIADIITTYCTQQEINEQGRPALRKGAAHYTSVLKIDSEKILSSIREEIVYCERDLFNIEKKKRDPIKKIAKLNAQVSQLTTNAKQHWEKIIDIEYKQRLAKSLRKLPKIGKSKLTIDFEWPTEKDVM